jgi:predicted aminopeptidase
LEQGAGQIKLRLSQIPLDEAIVSEQNQQIKKLLAAVPEIKQYAATYLKLEHNDNYTSYYATEKEGISFVVTASPQTELKPYTWWFPVIGSVPYKGFFNREDALALEKKLQNKGYDTWLFAAPAYSTLGWFKDPLTTPMLKRGYYSLASTLIHEMVHTTLYIEGEGDFNEQLASFVEDKGTIGYFQHHGLLTEKKRQKIKERKTKAKAFSKLLSENMSLLEEVYSGNLSRVDKLARKKELFDELERELNQLYQGRPEGYWSFNNARMLQYNRYREDSELLNGFWIQSNKDWKRFWQLVFNYVEQQDWRD